MESDEPREMTAEEIDRLPMETIDKITALLPLEDYRTSKEPDGTSGHIMKFENGGRFEVIYDTDGKPVDYRAEGVRFETDGERITVRAKSN